MKKTVFILFIAGVLLTGCIKQNNLFIDKGNIISFKFEKDKNPQLSHDIELRVYGNNKIAGYLDEKVDISNLVATFNVERGKLYVNDIIQISQKTPNNFGNPIHYKLEGDNNKFTEYTVTLVPYTGLPIAIIQTDHFSSLKDRENWLSGILEIDGMGKTENFRDSIKVKGRGNATWKYPKKPFNIKLNKKEKVLDMPKHKRWSFLANYSDRTLLRNHVTFHLGNIADNLEWTPKNQFVEVIFNGEYQGNFQVCEQIRVDKNRVNIKEMTNEDIEEDNITGGYLLEYDSYYDEINRFRSTINNWPVNIKSPDEEVLNTLQLDYIKKYTNKIEHLMSENEFVLLYDEYLDIKSFIDYWMIQTLVGNRELNTIHSVYCYKDRGNKLHAGPLWDFDYSTFTVDSEYNNKNAVWYKYLFQDPIFKENVKMRFSELKPIFTTIPQYIEKQAAILTPSVESNWEIWTIDLSYINEKSRNKDETLTYQQAIERMIYIYQGRLVYLENIIDEL